MSGEKRDFLGFSSHDKYALEEATEAEDYQAHESSSNRSAKSKMGRWALVALSVITFAFWGNGSETTPRTIEQRVDQILSKSPLIGMKRSIE